MPGILATIEAAATATSAVAKEIAQRDSEKNTAPEVKALEAQRLQSEKDQVNKIIAAGDLAAERKEDAE